MPMAGFDRRSGLSTGVLDELYVSAIALIADDGTPFVLVSFDLLGADRKLCTAVCKAIAAQSGMDEADIWVSATHTHSAPSGIFYGRTNYCADYTALLCEKSCKAAERALREAQSVCAALGTAQTEGIASLRDRPRTQAEYAMPLMLLRLEGAGAPVMLCRFTCHATVLDEHNTLFSRDLPGAAAQALADGSRCLFLNGACADLSTRYTRAQSTPGELARIGRLMASTLEGLRVDTCDGFGSRIRAIRRTLCIPRGGSLPDAERRRLLVDLQSRKAAVTDTAALREIDAKLAVLARQPAAAESERAVDISAVDFGSLILLGLPFEVSSADGRMMEAKLSAAAEKPVFVACYTGGYDGYLPSGAPLCADSNYQDFASRYPPQIRQTLFQCVKSCIDALGKMKTEKTAKGNVYEQPIS